MAGKYHEYRVFRGMQIAYEAKWRARAAAMIRRQVRRVLRYVKENGQQAAITYLELLIPRGDAEKFIQSLYLQVGVAAANEQTRIFRSWEGAKAFGLNLEWRQAISLVLAIFAGDKITSITDTTREWIKKVLEEGISNGWNYEQLAKALVSSDIPLMRARVIARTETVAAVGVGQMEAARKISFKLIKIWLNIGDKRVRETHKDAPRGVGNEQRELEEPFSNGCMQPGDPKGQAKEVINCRCVVAFERQKQPRRAA